MCATTTEEEIAAALALPPPKQDEEEQKCELDALLELKRAGKLYEEKNDEA